MTPVVKNNNPDFDTIMQNNSEIKCMRCNRTFCRKDYLRKHQETCDGLDPKQCRVCLKIFTTKHGKWKHTRFVKCSPPVSSSSVQHINNIDNSINTQNINNTNNVQINIMREGFDKITNEHIQKIVEKIKQSDYMQMITDNIEIGKYVIPRTMEHIYFNDMFP